MNDINSSIKPYDPKTYIQTAHTLNRVSRKSILLGTSNIVLGGKCIIHEGAVVRGDLKRSVPGGTAVGGGEGSKGSSASGAAGGGGQSIVIVTGRYCVIGEGAVIRPPYKTYKG